MDPPTTEATLASHDEDRISSLPDEVIANILSRLKLKQALATSLLSKRWRYLWITHVTDLDFDVKHLSRPSSKVGAKFVELVDGILQQYNKSGDRDRSLHRFSITNNDICTKYKSFIGRWIKFALSKQVKELELELWNRQQLCTRGVPKEYMLSSDIFADADAEADTVLETWQQNSSQIPPTYGSSWTVGLRNLKHLTLKTVTVEGKFIDYLLANCLVLEQLVLRSCNFSKSKLRVSGQSLKLKVLQIKSCSYFTHIEIYDVNLVSLTYMGSDLPLRIENVPQLVELCIGGWQPTTLRPVLDGLSTSVSHIHILRLEFFDMEDSFIPEMPILKSVTQLEITLFGTDDVSLFCFAPFIEACPKLQTFMLKILEGNRVASTVKKREIQRIVGLPLPYLEFVKFHGFYGESTHYELVQYLMDNAVALKKLVVDTHPRLGAFKNYNKTDVVKEEMSKSRECAKEQLEGKFLSRVELVII